ncbi:unnamed protein product, partial [Polarella glacialis]
MADAWENGLGIAFPLDGAGLIPTSVQQDYRLLQWRLTQTESRLAKLEGASCELRIGNLEREVRRLLTTVGATITVPPGDRGSARPSGLGFSGMSVGPEAAATGPQDPLGETYREGFSLGSMSPVRDAEENCPPFMQEGSAMPELLFEHGVALPVFAPVRPEASEDVPILGEVCEESLLDQSSMTVDQDPSPQRRVVEVSHLVGSVKSLASALSSATIVPDASLGESSDEQAHLPAPSLPIPVAVVQTMSSLLSGRINSAATTDPRFQTFDLPNSASASSSLAGRAWIQVPAVQRSTSPNKSRVTPSS